MDYTILNQKLSDLQSLRDESTLIKKMESDDEDVYEEEWFEIYPFDGENFLKLKIQLDSYGETESVISIQIVKEVETEITKFE